MFLFGTKGSHTLDNGSYIIVFENDEYMKDLDKERFKETFFSKTNKIGSRITFTNNIIFLSVLIDEKVANFEKIILKCIEEQKEYLIKHIKIFQIPYNT